MTRTCLLLVSWLAMSAGPASGQSSTEMQKITGGTFVPLYGADSAEVHIDDFYLDVYPVTNAQFVDFVRSYPNWRRSQVIRLFADQNYLRTWADDTTLGAGMLPRAPVTYVSWFAAKAYCECLGKRLPTMDEWEYVAMADEKQKDARADSLFNQRIISGYETPDTHIQPVGSTYRNFWGIYDMHGLIWEWTSDFNSVLISGESRKDGDTDRNLFCAAGSVNATDLMNYAAFMRYALRGSIKARYSLRSLGFRCAKDVSE